MVTTTNTSYRQCGTSLPSSDSMEYLLNPEQLYTDSPGSLFITLSLAHTPAAFAIFQTPYSLNPKHSLPLAPKAQPSLLLSAIRRVTSPMGYFEHLYSSTSTQNQWNQVWVLSSHPTLIPYVGRIWLHYFYCTSIYLLQVVRLSYQPTKAHNLKIILDSKQPKSMHLLHSSKNFSNQQKKWNSTINIHILFT